jgi:integrase
MCPGKFNGRHLAFFLKGELTMAKQRNGYVYQEMVWYGMVEYKDQNGKLQKKERRGNNKAHAEELADKLARQLKEKFGASFKGSARAITRKEGWLARLTYADETGKRRNVKRRAENKTEAKEELKRLINKLEGQGEQALDGDTMTFRDLASVYEKRKLIPAEYHGDRKVRGLRSYKTPLGYLKTLSVYFGNRRIKNITHSDVETFKQMRLKTPLSNGDERTIAAVNRELELLRAILRFASRQGWLLRSPFELGTPLISKADEVRRERILTFEEEALLLSVCTGRRSHLKPLLIAALDTAARRGELFKLTWADVDLDNRLINLRAATTKTQRGRIIGMTQRLYSELKTLFEKSTQDKASLVFGITDTIKTSFAAACREAKIEEFRFHDCRHTAITRMVQSGMPSHLIMKVSGHTQPITFSRYVNIDEQTARQAASALDRFNDTAIAEVVSKLVN